MIPNWNGLRHLAECFDSLRAQTFTDHVVILVDNGSEDESVAWTRAHYPEVEIVELDHNGGFSVAVNAGIRAAQSRYIALLNNDTACDPKWLECLVDALDTAPEFDAAASLMVLYDDSAVTNSAGDMFSMAQGSGVNRGLWQQASAFQTPGRVLGVSPGAGMYRAQYFETVGLFDEAFFVAAEDTDLNLRALIAGMSVVYVPGAVVRHKLRATRGVGRSWKMDRSEIRNNGIVAGKDLPWDMAVLWLLLVPWRAFRNGVPLRPSKWPNIVQSLPKALRTIPVEVGGFFFGVRRRGPVWARRAVSMAEIRKWIRDGFVESA